ncbi:MAG: hypothetical protein HY866_11435 [Chloroflexi bacterium]|nr:hypothetical protein [Chloroflexota bacterium]
MKRLLLCVLFGIGIIVWGRVALSDRRPVQRVLTVTSTPTPRLTPLSSGLETLPRRPTITPAPLTPFVWSTPNSTPGLTSPFLFDTLSPTPSVDCAEIFPLDNVSAIEFGQTTIPQLEASFGRAERVGGRPIRVRFDEQGCSLFVTIGIQEALEAELTHYGTLAFLLEQYGVPDAVGISQGNLTLLIPGQAVLLYAEAGVIAIFEIEPDWLIPETPINSLQLRPAYEVARQVKRLKLQLVDWQPPEDLTISPDR